jgi:hypothetical protein
MTTHPASPADWKHATEVFKTIADPYRLDALLLLAEGSRPARDIHVSQGGRGKWAGDSTMRRLRHLKTAGLVDLIVTHKSQETTL